MSFKIAVIVCLILMGLMACITFYLAKKVSNSFMKYIPVFSFAIGVLFFYINLNNISYNLISSEVIYNMIAFIILLIVGSIAFLEAVIIDVVENRKLFRKSYRAVQKTVKLVSVNRTFNFKMPTNIVNKIKGLL
ncbi:hypothetical protein [Psychrobacillus sp.]|uniref:hypothetical protein n=1 Tax=Psychrobacillus sp. TaxID=1871623 RepID=UPI0028BD5F7A|nr:hypothetical protein [Psychrobacillus sp.]